MRLLLKSPIKARLFIFAFSLFIYWNLPSVARNNLETVNKWLRRFGADPEKLLVCAKTARFDSQFTLTLKIERRRLSRCVQLI